MVDYGPVLPPEGDDEYFSRFYKHAIDPTRTPAQRAAERRADENPDQVSIWDALATR